MSRLPEWRCSSTTTGWVLFQRTDNEAGDFVSVTTETYARKKSHSPGVI